jgi:hypothetical protein
VTFSLTLTITHPGLAAPIVHRDTVHASSHSAALKRLDLSNKHICDLKNAGVARWTDENGARHKLELKHEAT